MDWDWTYQELLAGFRRVEAAVRSLLPGIGARIERGPASPSIVFHASLGFVHLPFEASVEEIVLEFACGPSETGGFWNEKGRLLFPDTRGQHAVRFEIARGTGEVFKRLTPILLPPDEASPEYEQAVRSFVTQSIQLAEKSVPLIVETLRAGRA